MQSHSLPLSSDTYIFLAFRGADSSCNFNNIYPIFQYYFSCIPYLVPVFQKKSLGEIMPAYWMHHFGRWGMSGLSPSLNLI
jgi:hypothetical protein